ncbi:FAD-binding oxidoreductase [Thermomicrobium sp. 4228-Ro]|uniref:NAD(P)/FAD-dependent oxidoreductase n=1 Tax=Thermomicrobium sp. 4228-Ro TaxID=2993937 RepID=UPI002249639A|nr:FAD-binding oxidoreductase [Thermomicrobium sp. 4228-Ro]MCX2726043.1 FAD-binding oxidoreductase [Thermomicrobium sp. 4228-Ro]
MSTALPNQANVVIIGTGAFGLSVAAQLARAGVTDVLVLDRFACSSQTSSRAAGLFKLVQADELRTHLARLSTEIVRSFHREMGVRIPYVHSGSLLIARSDRHADVIQREIAAARAWGVEVELLSPTEASRLAPYLAAQPVRLAAYVPGDIYIEEPASLLASYRIAAERFGARIVEQVPVTGVVVETGAVRAVETPHGRIRTEIVVDAAGAWVRSVAKLAGSDLAVMPVRHQLAITEAMPGTKPEQPIVRIIDAAVYVRPCRGGLMWGGFEANPLPLDPATHGETFSIDRLPLDFGVLQRLAEAVRDVVPVLHDAPIQEHRGGLFTMTPDGRFLVGPVPGVTGFWVLSGCNGSGFSFSPALGWILAEWIVAGTPPLDVSLLEPARFASPYDDATLRQTAIYQYTHYYEPVE